MIRHNFESDHVFTHCHPCGSHNSDRWTGMARRIFIVVLGGAVLMGLAWCSLVAAKSPPPSTPATVVASAAKPIAKETDTMTSDLQKTATQAERYINEHLFDPDGLMYSYIDVQTGKIFEEDYVAHYKENVRRAKSWNAGHRSDSDPVTYWSYEDTIATAGYYIEALVLKYELTADSKALEQAFKIWDTYKQVYYASQVYGIGSFLRPYGGRAADATRGGGYGSGFEGLGRWMEPLGTDQASPLLSAQYALWKHAKGGGKKELADIIIKTLSWYEQQDFCYLWYKSYIHWWNKGGHAGSYYLPAIAFAAQVTGEEKWQKLLQEKLPLAQGSGSNLMTTFKWGSDLVMLADLLGPDFEKAFPQTLLDSSYEEALKYLATFTLPGMSVPRGWGSRQRPTEQGFYFLCGLAGLGHPGAAEKALSVLSASKKVPEDFTVFLNEDSEKLPLAGYVQLQARAVGRPLVRWYLNYWILRKATLAQK